MIVPTTPQLPRKLIPHEFSCQSKTRKINPQNLFRVWIAISTEINTVPRLFAVSERHSAANSAASTSQVTTREFLKSLDAIG